MKLTVLHLLLLLEIIKMATIPCSLLIKSTDSKNFTTEDLYTVCKVLFRFGLKKLEQRNDNQVMVQLGYTPRTETLRRKFGDLPVTYIRLNLENKTELARFGNILKRYHFNLMLTDGPEEQVAAAGPSRINILENRMLKAPTTTTTHPKRKRIMDSDGEEEEEDGELIAEYDDDAADHRAQ